MSAISLIATLVAAKPQAEPRFAPIAVSKRLPRSANGTKETATSAGKDGSLTPMGTSPDVATSAQDAQAQSEGGKTAAEQAAGAKGTESRAAALEEARAALAKGDEEACMAAVEKAKGM